MTEEEFDIWYVQTMSEEFQEWADQELTDQDWLAWLEWKKKRSTNLLPAYPGRIAAKWNDFNQKWSIQNDHERMP